MKNFLFLLPVLFFLNCSQSSSNEAVNLISLDKNGNPITQIKFEYYKSDAGEVEQDTVIKYNFPFTNIGNVPLVISNCKSSCGCVVPECPRKPIAPGDSGVFKAQFNTKGKSGVQTKTLTMTANTEPAYTVLRLKAVIIPKGK